MNDTRGGYTRGTSDAGSRYSERRSVPRYPVATQAEVIEPLSNLRLVAHVTEISLNGCFVTVEQPLPRHSVFQVRMTHEGEPLEAWARVVYVQAGKGMGASFLKIEEKPLGLLRSWLAQLAAAAD
jgi:PilZ domain